MDHREKKNIRKNTELFCSESCKSTRCFDTGRQDLCISLPEFGIKNSFVTTGISLTPEQMKIVIHALRREVISSNPKSLSKLSKTFDFYLSDVSLGEIALKNFPQDYIRIWKKKTPTVKYTEQDDILFKTLFEQLGTYDNVRLRIIKDTSGKKTPKVITISKRLKNLFKGRKDLFLGFSTYDDWFNSYSKQYELAVKGGFKTFVYSENDVKKWISLFEQMGFFSSVAKFLKNISKGKNSPEFRTIQRRINEYFELNNMDFLSWVKKYHNNFFVWEAQKRKGIYTTKDDEFLIKSYEQLGNFPEVSENFYELFDIKIKYQTIIARLSKYFGEGFESWRAHYFNSVNGKNYYIGKLIHNVLEYLFVKFSISNNLTSFFEVRHRIYSNNFRVDNAIIRNRTFTDVIEKNQNILLIPKNIKIITIDYTIARHEEDFEDKLLKYHGPKTFLIVVALKNDIFKTNFYNNLHRVNNNVAILNIQDFSSFMNYESDPKIKQVYRDSILLARNANERDTNMKNLANLSQKFKKELDLIKNKFSHNSYIRYIRKKGLDYLLYQP